MASPMSSWVSADNPLGRSTETIGMPDPLRSATTIWNMPPRGFVKPVPKIASTITSQSEISEKCRFHAGSVGTSTTGRPSRPRMLRFNRASPATSATRARRNTETSMPRCFRARATTKPSPPLLPRPHTTVIRRFGRSSKVVSMAVTTWRAAFSISTIDGIPRSSIVRRSASRICAPFNMRMGITVGSG